MKKMRSLTELYSVINRNTLPPVIRDYYIRDEGERFSLTSDIKELESLLLEYKASTKSEKVNTYIFLAILGLFSGKYKLSLFFIRKAEALEMTREQTWLMMEIKYSIRKLDKILILVSKPDDENSADAIPLDAIRNLARRVNRNSGSKKYPNRLVVRYINSITTADFNACFTKFEQVFIVGHGDDVDMQLGGSNLDPKRIVSRLKGKLDKPNVLGIFSCGEAFNTKEIWSHVDYFITDTHQSSPIFFEMFLYGYISSYYRNKDVLKAFDSGWILPVINAIGDPYFALREKGYQVRP